MSNQPLPGGTRWMCNRLGCIAVSYQSYRIDGVGTWPHVQSAWNAIASGAGSPLTIFEWE